MAKRTHVDKATSDEVHDAAIKLMHGIGSYFAENDRAINEIIFVPLAIMARIVRLHEATVALLKEGYVSEAAILALTAFELRVDLLDVASDVQRATAWVEHGDIKQKSGRMKPTLDRHFDKTRADRMYEIFRNLSGIKHGNPIYSDLAFPVTKRRNTMKVTTGPIENASAQAFSRAVFAYSTYQLVWSAHVLNKYVARYAIVELPVRQKVQHLFNSLRKVETEFREHCRRKVGSKASFFDMKKNHKLKRPVPRGPASSLAP